MSNLSRPGSLSMTCSLMILSACFIALVVTAAETSGFFEGQSARAQNTNSQNNNSSRTTTTSRPPLPKPSAPRFFERYEGRDSSSRLTKGGGARQTEDPRRPVAPLEGRAFDLRPFFKWQIAPESKSYHFAIYEGDREKEPSGKAVYETDLPVTELAYPQNAPPLKPGKLYSWQVSTPTSTGKDDVGVVARLIILAGAERAEVQKALAKAGLTSPKTPSDRLDRARVFENYGVWYDALRIVSNLAQDPKDKEALAYYKVLLDKLEPKP